MFMRRFKFSPQTAGVLCCSLIGVIVGVFLGSTKEAALKNEKFRNFVEESERLRTREMETSVRQERALSNDNRELKARIAKFEQELRLLSGDSASLKTPDDGPVSKEASQPNLSDETVEEFAAEMVSARELSRDELMSLFNVGLAQGDIEPGLVEFSNKIVNFKDSRSDVEKDVIDAGAEIILEGALEQVIEALGDLPVEERVLIEKALQDPEVRRMAASLARVSSATIMKMGDEIDAAAKQLEGNASGDD
jgi:hypothetical protein